MTCALLFERLRRLVPCSLGLGFGVVVLGWAVLAQQAAAQEAPASPPPPAGIKDTLATQRRQIEEQERALREQAAAIERQRRQLEAIEARIGARPAPATTKAPATAAGPEEQAAAPGQVLAVPAQRPEVAALSDVGGVLTRRGQLILEPSLQYIHSSDNRFTFSGIEIIDTVLIGIIQARQSNRDMGIAALTGRLGLTNRLEVETKVPYAYRRDRDKDTITTGGLPIENTVSGHGIGDVEGALHYQINEGQGMPYFVGNFRVKSNSGTGPFDVAYNAQGIESELPTGSGFWAIQPSVTAILPSDPAVLYANLGYMRSFGQDINQAIGNTTVLSVRPGDAISGSFGVGVSLNENLSVSVGYDHNYIHGTKTVTTTSSMTSSSLQVGSLSFGLGYRLSDRVSINWGVSAGLTDDAPNVQATIRVPIALNIF